MHPIGMLSCAQVLNPGVVSLVCNFTQFRMVDRDLVTATQLKSHILIIFGLAAGSFLQASADFEGSFRLALRCNDFERGKSAPKWRNCNYERAWRGDVFTWTAANTRAARTR